MLSVSIPETDYISDIKILGEDQQGKPIKLHG
jgi:hypothetical protein